MLKRLASIFIWSTRIFLLVVSFYYLYLVDILSTIIFLLAFLISILPVVFRLLYAKNLHWVYDVFVSFMITGHMIGFMGLYYRSMVYDDVLHLFGSVALGIIVFSIVYAYHHTEKIKLTPSFLFYLTILLTLSLGAIWEILEFMWDNFVLLSSQYGFAQDSLLDTMLDLSWDLVGGVIATIIMTKFVRKSKEETLDNVFKPIAKLFSGKSQKI